MAAGRPIRRRHGGRPPDLQRRRTRPAPGHHRHHLPAIAHRAGVASRSQDPGRPERPHPIHRPSQRNHLLALAQDQVRLYRRSKKPYTFSVQPFLVDKQSATQGYLASEPYTIEQQTRQKPTVFLLGEYGYPPYAQTLVTTRSALTAKRDALQRFVQASAEGWKSYLANPAAGNALILKDNPQMTPALLDYGVKALKQAKLVDGGDAAKRGLLTMTDARWKATYDFMVKEKLLAPSVDYRKAFTTELVDKVNVLP
ncbi:ABC transporter substrate-binding protein [Pigmentiphaga litoralis]|uniref:ABC transporter substrate-binding protein n=1 Tax=Pigmentiphaga litoralis TaxID=516702 RepID=UPI003B435B8A